MKHKTAAVAVILAVIAQVTAAQSNTDAPAGQGFTISPIVSQAGAIPEGYSFTLSAAFPPYERKASFGYGNVSLGLAGLFEVTVSHEGAIGSPIGLLRPANVLGLRLQIVPQRERYPAVSVFLATTTETQSEFLGDTDLKPDLPEIYQAGVRAISYEAKTTVAGVAFSTRLNDMISLNASLGGREMVWRQMWGIYLVNVGLPSTGDGWTFPMAERSNLRLDWSAGASLRPLNQLAVIGQVASLPFADIDPSSLIIEARQGYVGTIGVRYFLPIPLSIDLYDRWYSETRERTNYHQLRLGLSTELLFQ